MPIPLCPAQKIAYDGLLRALPACNVLVLAGDQGSGKTTVLLELHHAVGGAFLSAMDLVNAMRSRHPLSLEETFAQIVMDAFAANEYVFIDDLNLLEDVVGGCGEYPRAGFLEASLTALCGYAIGARKKLILSGVRSAAVRQRSYAFGIHDFTATDYEFLCRAHLGAAAGGLDYEKIYRFATALNAHQLKATCVWLKPEENLDTDRFIDYLRTQYLGSNVDLDEVQQLQLRDLKGVDEIIQSLEDNIILPLENDELAKELALKPKRGVLLAGPPGTGKTSVGRALAHRLKSKFFLLDGTFIAGTQSFYHSVQYLFASAKQNAPSIIFIDDSDAIFESGEELGLYRYLLTMLDGLESTSAGRVCVILTAMDISHLPPALIRSGRIELWLEMRLPDDKARGQILEALLAKTPVFRQDLELAAVVSATSGFTGADLKRLVEDGKLLFAHDKAHGLPQQPVTNYFVDAVETMRKDRERYAEAETRSRQQRSSRAPSPNGPG